MTRQTDLLDSLRGDASKTAFARHIGICLRALSYIEAGRPPGRRTIQRLIQAYPARCNEIILAFLNHVD